MRKTIYFTHDGGYIYEWERKYYSPAEYYQHGYRVIENTKRRYNYCGRYIEHGDPCVEDIKQSILTEIKIKKWARGVKPRIKRRKP